MAPPKRNLLSRIIKSTSCKICRTLLMHVSVFATQSSHGHIFLQCYQFLILRSICIAPTKSFSTILPQILDAFRYILSHPSFLRARHYVKHKSSTKEPGIISSTRATHHRTVLHDHNLIKRIRNARTNTPQDRQQKSFGRLHRRPVISRELA